MTQVSLFLQTNRLRPSFIVHVLNAPPQVNLPPEACIWFQARFHIHLQPFRKG